MNGIQKVRLKLRNVLTFIINVYNILAFAPFWETPKTQQIIYFYNFLLSNNTFKEKSHILV